MATTNISVGTAWVKLAADTDTPVLISNTSSDFLEIATTVADAAPTSITGHIIDGLVPVTRDIIGTGFVWGRITGQYDDQAEIVVTK